MNNKLDCPNCGSEYKLSRMEGSLQRCQRCAEKTFGPMTEEDQRWALLLLGCWIFGIGVLLAIMIAGVR